MKFYCLEIFPCGITCKNKSGLYCNGFFPGCGKRSKKPPSEDHIKAQELYYKHTRLASVLNEYKPTKHKAGRYTFEY